LERGRYNLARRGGRFLILYQEKKIENAIAYFASEYHKGKGYYPTQTWVYKFLAILDSRILRKTGTPCFGLEYSAMEKGPVPMKLYTEVKDKQTFVKGKVRFKFQPDPDKVYVSPAGEPDLDFFSDLELDEMDVIFGEVMCPSVSLDSVIEKAHEEIKSWQIAWQKAKSMGRKIMPMDYSDEFDSITEKPESELSPEEERFLCYKGMLAKEREAFAVHS
jgi:hypothetical protein